MEPRRPESLKTTVTARRFRDGSMERFTIADGVTRLVPLKYLRVSHGTTGALTTCIMATPRSGDTLREIAVRYVGFAMIGCSVVVGEVLARVDELISGGVRVRSS